MNDLLIARSQMGMSLAFHIVFAAIGIALPLMMCVAEWLWIKTGDEVYYELAKRWSKGAAILFAVGAVSGTVLSFELGLLWPGFMKWSGEIIGLPFALEGFAFFTEAIFLGIYLYGWKLVPKAMHLLAGVIVSISGAASALFVILANGWMNTPTGFRLVDGKPVDIDPVAAMLNPAALPEAVHMLIAAYAATAFLAAGIHSYMLLRDKTNLFHRRALAIALALGGTMAIIQPLSGDILAQMVAHVQPVKLAALEAHFETKRGAPLTLGGIPDQDKAVVHYGVEIPYALSLLAFHDPNAEVKGLKDFPREHWPNVLLVHYCFQIMVGCGTVMMLVSAWAGAHFVMKRTLPDSVLFLRTMVICSPLGFIATETGWFVTELGRQPWVVQGIMLTKDAVTPMRGLAVPFLMFTALYLFLGVIVVYLIKRQIIHSPKIKVGEK
jgi:cytochrome bd ubiquinol oxidase subunit I